MLGWIGLVLALICVVWFRWANDQPQGSRENLESWIAFWFFLLGLVLIILWAGEWLADNGWAR